MSADTGLRSAPATRQAGGRACGPACNAAAATGCSHKVPQGRYSGTVVGGGKKKKQERRRESESAEAHRLSGFSPLSPTRRVITRVRTASRANPRFHHFSRFATLLLQCSGAFLALWNSKSLFTFLRSTDQRKNASVHPAPPSLCVAGWQRMTSGHVLRKSVTAALTFPVPTPCMT